jgi:thymidylate kinase
VSVRVFTVSGLDGSGKSTQVARLTERLEAHGERVYYFHAVHFSVAQLRRRLAGKKPSTEQLSELSGVTRASAATIALRKVFLRIDLVRYRRLLRTLATRGYTAVVSDRYYYDNLVNIAYLEGSSSFVRVTPPRPTLAVYLAVSPDDLIARDRVAEQGVEYLVAKRSLYDAVAEEFGLTVIDGAMSATAVEHAIESAIAAL